VLNIETYNYKQWHGSLLTLAFLLIAIIFNTLLARRLPMVEGIFVFCHVLGVLIFIPVWVLSPRREGGSPLTEFYNPGGWASNGIATMVGTVGPITSLIGFDCSIHMGKSVPFCLLLLTYLLYS
jgi:amino acid transporter